MSNAMHHEFLLSPEAQAVKIYGTVDIGATGAPTLKAWVPNVLGSATAAAYGTANATLGWHGIKTISRVSAGKYTVTFNQNYVRLLKAGYSVTFATISLCCSMFVLTDTITSSTAPALVIQFVDYAGSAVDPASGERILLDFEFANSSAT